MPMLIKATLFGLIVLALIESSYSRRGGMMVSVGTMSMSPAANRAGNDEEADLALLGESLDESAELARRRRRRSTTGAANAAPSKAFRAGFRAGFLAAHPATHPTKAAEAGKEKIAAENADRKKGKVLKMKPNEKQEEAHAKAKANDPAKQKKETAVKSSLADQAKENADKEEKKKEATDETSSEKPLATAAECQRLDVPLAKNGHTRRRRRCLVGGGSRMSSFMPCKEKVFEHKIKIDRRGQADPQYLCKSCYSECGHYLVSTHAQGGFCNSFDFEEDFSRCHPSCYNPDWEPTQFGNDQKEIGTRRRRGVPGYPTAVDPASPNMLCTKKCIIHNRGTLQCARAGGCGTFYNDMWKNGSNLNCGSNRDGIWTDNPNRSEPCGKDDRTLSKNKLGIFCDGYKQTSCTSNPEYNATCAEAKPNANVSAHNVSCACKTPNECIKTNCQIYKQVTTARICVQNRYSEHQQDEKDQVGFANRYDDQATKRVFKGGGAGRHSPLQASLCSTDPDDCKSDYCATATASF